MSKGRAQGPLYKRGGAYGAHNEEGRHRACPYVSARMSYDPDVHHRRSIRLHGYDYSRPGSYYVTICIEHYRCLLGEVVQGRMNWNDAGQMVDYAWRSIPDRFPSAQLDEYIVMPNHFHGILRIVRAPLVGAHDTVRAPPVGAQDRKTAGTRPVPTFGEMVGSFKSITTDQYIYGVRDRAWPAFDRRFWHRNFYEHIIRDEDELEKVRAYIRQNPLRWECDRYNPDRGVPVVDGEGRVVPWDES